MKVNAKLVTRRKAQKSTGFIIAQNGTRLEGNPRGKARTSKKEWKWQRGIVAHPLSKSRWNKGHFSIEKSGSLRSTNAGACHASRGLQGPRCHWAAPCWVALEKWGAYGWAVVQLDCDEEFGALAWDFMAQWREGI